jgi:nucleotide-binding universal stress UspA family protein
MATHDVIVGYDGSPDAAGAIELGAKLLPDCSAVIVHLWAPPFAASELRLRITQRAGTVKDMIDLLEREARAEADRVAAEGATLARAAGWDAEAFTKLGYGAQGLELAALAEEREPDVLVVGSRGLRGARAVLGSVSDEAAHASPVSVLVVPRLVLTAEREAAGRGPVLVGDDGSDGAARARERAHDLFADRDVVAWEVADVGSGRAVAAGLFQRAQELGAALVVVGSRGRSAAREIVLGSAAMATLHHADRPVMVVPAAR